MEENKKNVEPVLIFPNEPTSDVVGKLTLQKYDRFVDTLTNIVLKYQDKIA